MTTSSHEQHSTKISKFNPARKGHTDDDKSLEEERYVIVRYRTRESGAREKVAREEEWHERKGSTRVEVVRRAARDVVLVLLVLVSEFFWCQHFSYG